MPLDIMEVATQLCQKIKLALSSCPPIRAHRRKLLAAIGGVSPWDLLTVHNILLLTKSLHLESADFSTGAALSTSKLRTIPWKVAVSVSKHVCYAALLEGRS